MNEVNKSEIAFEHQRLQCKSEENHYSLKKNTVQASYYILSNASDQGFNTVINPGPDVSVHLYKPNLDHLSHVPLRREEK